MAANRGFFQMPTARSIAKVEIVTKYFVAWAQIMKSRCGSRQLTYLDLFSGPGEYEEGTPSTPMRIMNEVVKIPALQSRLRIAFFEKKREYYDHLKNLVEHHPAYSWLTTEPKVECAVIRPQSVPTLPIDDYTLCFADPYGYKGISLRLLQRVLENWGSDCIFYLSITGLRRNLELEKQTSDIAAIFGDDGLQRLRLAIKEDTKPATFRRVAIRELLRAVNRNRQMYVLPFGIEYESNKSVSHYLVFMSKHHRGYAIMKEIMAKYSMLDPAGIPYFRYRSPQGRSDHQNQLGMSERMERLEQSLLTVLSSRPTLTSFIVEECHKKGLPVVQENIIRALENLESKALIHVSLAPGKQRRSGHILPSYYITRLVM